jgi:hypothetical protein
MSTLTIVVSPDPLSPTPAPSSVMMTPQNVEGEPDAPESAAEEIQME